MEAYLWGRRSLFRSILAHRFHFNKPPVGTSVHKPPGNTPDSSRWHHVHSIEPVEKDDLAIEGGHSLSEAQEQNKALVRRLYDAQTKGDLHAMRELLTPDFDDHWLAPGQEEPGREGYIRSNAVVHGAFSDIRYLIEEQMAAEGHRVVSRLRIRGTLDRGPFMGFAPDGKEREVSAIVIHRIEGDKIAEEWREGSGVLELTRARLEKEIGERERVDQELRVARRIQHASLPEEVPTLEGWQISPFYQPAREVGGDFYDFHLLSEGRLGLVVGDATGKVVPAALVMATTLGMLQAVSQALDSSSSGEVLS